MTQYILVADAARARLVRADDTFEDAEEVEDFVHPTARAKARDLVTSQNTTSTAMPQGPRSATEEPDPQELESRKFAQQLAARLNHARATNEFERLILVAPPKFLGMLREELDAPTTKTIVASVHKDYTHESLKDALAAIQKQITASSR